MSVVLYALGVLLLLWSGFLLVTGDMIATLDIAANLAGSGAFAIGLGAVADAIGRLTRAVASRPVEAHADIAPALPFVRHAPPAPPAEPLAPPRPEPAFGDLSPRELEPDPEPVAPSGRREPRLPRVAELAPSVPAPARAAERAEPAPPIVETPPVVAPILGGGVLAAAYGAGAPASAERERQDDIRHEADEPEPAAHPQPVEPVAADIEPEPIAAPAPEKPEPRVPEWLARARARREARAQSEPEVQPDDDRPAGDDDAPEPQVADEPVQAEPETATAEAVAETRELEPDDASPSEVADDTDPSRQVVREGEHNGVFYRFFADGSIEAQREHGARRFASIEELRATIIAARGRLDEDDAADPAAAETEATVEAENVPAAEDAAEPLDPPRASEPEPQPDAEPEPQPEPEPTPDPKRGGDEEFEAALAALEGRPSGEPAGPDRTR
ncbi:hypothetical protein [Methylopila turkensis]|uniref:Uncharacterized protein n=1 Tax=Methylopila turkensis TaxID=1437816 RepID=A0A9W6JPW3_9HYPH|nr:hypothetical protein [Methylopila turkensis]GLK79684.1 hypothetical protein GCM10008174_14250 [Methylopila turkensis]